MRATGRKCAGQKQVSWPGALFVWTSAPGVEGQRGGQSGEEGCLLAMGFVYRWLPETKGLSVEEAVSVFERQNCSAIQVRDQGSRLPAVSA